MGACFRTIANEEQITFKRGNTASVLDEYTLHRSLGISATCRVMHASHKRKQNNTNQEVALKIMDKSRHRTEELYHKEVKVLNELTKCDPLNTSHIVPLLKYDEDSNYCYIATPFMSGGELFDRILTREEEYKITESIAIRLTLNMLQAVKYCHDHNVIHRDIKPENFVFKNKEIDSELVLIDFGDACIAKDDELIFDVRGTPYYLAPELAILPLNNYRQSGKTISDKIGIAKLRTARIFKAADIWSIGVISFIMMTGRAPFRGKTDIEIYESTCLKSLLFPKKDVRYHNVLQLSDEFKDFIAKILCKDPLQRITVEDAIKHVWIQGLHHDE